MTLATLDERILYSCIFLAICVAREGERFLSKLGWDRLRPFVLAFACPCFPRVHHVELPGSLSKGLRGVLELHPQGADDLWLGLAAVQRELRKVRAGEDIVESLQDMELDELGSLLFLKGPLVRCAPYPL